MKLKQTFDQLIELQAINTGITRHQKDKDALHLDVDQQRRVAEDVAKRRDELKAQQLESLKKADALELKIREAEEENRKLQVQLNTTKRQADYDVIRNSILSRQADISRWEDEALELLQRVDDIRREAAELDKRLTDEKQALQQIEQRVAHETAEYDRRIGELTQQRDGLRGTINDGILQVYDRLARSRGVTAIVRVKKRICQGCFTSLPKQTENELMRGTEIVYCHNCGRMLMLDEVSDAETEPQGWGPE